MTIEEAALLDAIATTESAGAWNVIYGGSKFNDYSAHPRKYVTITSGPNKGKKSSAAGKYQILASTYDRVAPKLGIKDFSPESQQKIALYLAREKYGPNLAQDLADGKAAEVATKLNGVWTSLPKGIEAGTNTSKFGRAYEAALASPRPPGSLPDVASSLDTGRSLVGAQSVAGGITPPPLPRQRPQPPAAEITQASFKPLPFPGRLQTPEAPAAAFSLMPPPIPSNAVMPPRASRWKEEGGEWQQGQAQFAAMSRPTSQPMTPQPPARPALMPFPALPRPGVGVGGVAGMGGMGGATAGVVPPGQVPPRVPPAVPREAATPPRYVPAMPMRASAVPPAPMPSPGFRAPVVAPPATSPPPIPQGGFDIGAVLGGLGNGIKTGFDNMGTTALNAVEGTKAALGNTAQSAQKALASELMGTVGGRTLLLNTLMGSKGTIHTNPGKYGSTSAARQEAAARRQALQEGRPYMAPSTAVRSSLSVPARAKPPRLPETRAERFTNLDPWGNII